MHKIGFVFILLLMSITSYAAEPLPVEQAFALSAKVQNNQLMAQWKIAPGYYLYRDRINFYTVDGKQAIKPISLPAGLPKEDEFLGKYQVYEHQVIVAIERTSASAVNVEYQGCARSGFCYPPLKKTLTILANNQVAISEVQSESLTTKISTETEPAERNKIQQLLHENLFLLLIGFFGLGLLLAFTPCVFPLLPILGGIIVGQGKAITGSKAFRLSLTYVLAMAVVYAGAGVVAGLLGKYVQAFLQTPWVISLFAVVFVLLALSLFGFYELQLPSKWQEKINKISGSYAGGTYVGVAIMGGLSVLIVSACVTAPLVGVLGYIGSTGSAVVGGFALFAMGLGFGLPLLIMGSLGGKFLPKSGAWMDTVKKVFGVIMLGMALWILARIIPPRLTLILFAALLIFAAVYLGGFTTGAKRFRGKLGQVLCGFILLYGAALLMGAAINHSPLLNALTFGFTKTAQLVEFKTVKNIADLDQVLLAAKEQHRPVMLDFYADWCISCKEMEYKVFAHERVRPLLEQFVLLRIDVTNDDEDARNLEKRFGVIAPPTVIFINADGQEVTAERVVGEESVEMFLEHLRKVVGA